MDHVYVTDKAVLETFPPNKWGIPEPTVEQAKAIAKTSAVEEKDIDFVVLPGVAFDKRCHRLGRGRGYYDSFLRRISEARGGTPVQTVALAFDEQWIDEVPMEAHDQPLHAVFSRSLVARSADRMAQSTGKRHDSDARSSTAAKT